jgi:hypothetical protein
LYKADDRRQWIIFANSRKELENNHLKRREFLDVKSLPGNIMMINGSMFRKQKFFYTNLFVNPELIDVSALLHGDGDPTLPAVCFSFKIETFSALKMKIKQLILMLLVSSIVTYQVQFDEEVDKQKNPKIIA